MQAKEFSTHMRKSTFIVIGFLIISIVVPFAWAIRAFFSGEVSIFVDIAFNIFAGGGGLMVIVACIVLYLVRRWFGSLAASLAQWDKGHRRVTYILGNICIVLVLLMTGVTIFAIPGEHTRIGVALIVASCLTTVEWVIITLVYMLFSIVQTRKKNTLG
jgi:hypothetical protein